MSVRAKFRVNSYTTEQYSTYPHQRENGQPDYSRPEPVEKRTVRLAPVYSDDPQSENRQFWDATPSGAIELGTINPAAWQQFEIGKEYYIDFTPANG